MSGSGRKLRNMAEFAAASGLSRPTVSKYFHDPRSVRDSTRMRIEAALERYEFRPNIYAVNQNRRQTKTIGIVVPYLADPFFSEIARTIERQCVEAGYRPLLFSANGDHEAEAEILDSLLALKPAGALLAPHANSGDTSALMAFSREVPTVLFDSKIDGVGEAFIGNDNAQSVSAIVDYLCETGSAPCFFEMPPINPNAGKRRAVYEAAMKRRDLEPMLVTVDGDSWNFEEIGYREGLHALERQKLPSDTVLCSNDRLAIGFLSAAYEKGLRVGKGSGFALRVAGHDDNPYSRFTCPSLTTVRQNYEAIAGASLGAVLDLIEAEEPTLASTETLFDGTLILRSSA